MTRITEPLEQSLKWMQTLCDQIPKKNRSLTLDTLESEFNKAWTNAFAQATHPSTITKINEIVAKFQQAVTKQSQKENVPQPITVSLNGSKDDF